MSLPLRHAYNHYRPQNPAHRAFALARRDLARGDRHYDSSPWTGHGTGRRPMNAKERWFEASETAGFRLAGFADEVLRSIRHRGWYVDESLDDVYRGVVYQLPARHGRTRYLYGYADPWNPGAAWLCFDPCDDKDDAARWADRIAERCAEAEREYRERENARLAAEEARERLHALNRRTLRLLADARATSLPASVCEVVRTALCDVLRERAELFATMERAL